MMAAVNKTPDLLQRDAGMFAEENARQYQRLLGKILAIFIFSNISRGQKSDFIIVFKCVYGGVRQFAEFTYSQIFSSAFHKTSWPV